MRIHVVQAKKGIKKLKYPDPFYVNNYSCCPYAACAHNCAYCDGRAEKYFVQGEFDKDIVVRENLPALLEDGLPKLKEPGVVTMGSGITDVYQPVEAQHFLQSACLQVLAKHNYAVSVQTKSGLILRDIDLLSSIHEDGGFIGMVTITFTDESLRLIFEPHASSVETRFDILRKFKEKGFYCGAFIMPMIPFLSADTDVFADILTKLREIGVDFAIPGLLTLRPGRQKAHFLRVLRHFFPDLLPHYNRIYGNEAESGMPRFSYCQKIYAKWAALQAGSRLPAQIPHRIFRRFYAKYDEALLLMLHMRELYEAKRADIGPLKMAIHCFFEWLKPRKNELFRKRKMSYKIIEDEFTMLLQNGQIKDVLQNQKLGAFLQEGLLSNLYFDYITLKWKN